MRHKIRTIFAAAAIAAGAFVSLPAQAATIVGDYLGGGSNSNFSRATGYHFTVGADDLNVTALGVYDLGSNGFADSHDVAIFDSSAPGVALASTTLASGLSGTFEAGTVDGTRFNAIATITLFANTSYYILANNFRTDQFAFGNGNVQYNSAITWNGFVDAASNDVNSNPNFLGGLPGNLGPNFKFTLAAIPIPASMLLLFTGIAGLFGIRRIRAA